MAQLILDGKNHGPHAFIVPIRDLKTHKPLPGVTVGDVGPKFGLNTLDNGFVLFDNVRIPHDNMLAKYSHVVKATGSYECPPNAKMAYGTMVTVNTYYSDPRHGSEQTSSCMPDLSSPGPRQ